MKHLRSTWQTIQILLTAVAGWLATGGAALAQEDDAGGGGGGSGSWVLSYMVVIFCVIVGMLTVCLSAKRADRGKGEYTDRARPMQIDYT